MSETTNLCPDRAVHGNPFRYCPTCDWTEPVEKVTQPPTIGRIVHYTLTEQEAAHVNKRRADAKNLNAAGVTLASQELGPQIHIGNTASAGDIYPAMIVRVWPQELAQLQVFLDGNDTLWSTSRKEGSGAGHWSWPPRA